MNSPAYSITTERLVIRCYEPNDVYLLKEAIDESLDHLRIWLPWAENEPEDIEKKIERFKKNRANFDLHDELTYGIFLPNQSKQIGSIGLFKRVGDNALEIGYWIHANYLNKGYATEATAAITKVAFEIEKVERLEIHCNPLNTGSAAIPKKLGFIHEATIRNNKRDKEGKRLESMIWVMFDDEYLDSDIKSYPIEAFDVLGRKII